MSHDLKTWEACRDWAVLPLSAPRNRHFRLYSNASEHSLRTCCSRAVDGCASATSCRRGFSDCVLSTGASVAPVESEAACAALQGLPTADAGGRFVRATDGADVLTCCSALPPAAVCDAGACGTSACTERGGGGDAGGGQPPCGGADECCTDVSGVVEHAGEDCWQECHGWEEGLAFYYGGQCRTRFCGAGLCCRLGVDRTSLDAGCGAAGCDGFNCCVDASELPIDHEDEPCYEQCYLEPGSMGAECPSFCGTGGLCCKKGASAGSDDLACGNRGGDDLHRCVRATAEHTPVLHEGEDCYWQCQAEGGFCETGFCGAGRCCRADDDADDGACGAALGCVGHHCCTEVAWAENLIGPPPRRRRRQSPPRRRCRRRRSAIASAA